MKTAIPHPFENRARGMCAIGAVLRTRSRGGRRAFLLKLSAGLRHLPYGMRTPAATTPSRQPRPESRGLAAARRAPRPLFRRGPAANDGLPSGRPFTRPSVLAVIALLSVPACGSRDTTTSRAAPAGSGQLSAPALPPISKWELDPENSSVSFACKHVFTNVRGMFQRPSGAVTLDEATPANSKLNATIDVNSITTGVEERDAHLKGPDFFDAAKYPVITFASTGFSKSSDASYAVTGNLTMHGVTRPVTLAVNAPPAFNHAGGIRRGVEATLSVNRKDYGLLWEFPGEGAGVVVGDTIKITIDAELVLQPAPNKGG